MILPDFYNPIWRYDRDRNFTKVFSALPWRLKLSCPLAPSRLLIIVGHNADTLTLTNDESGLPDLSAPEKGITGISDNLFTLWEIFVAGNPANLKRDALRLRSLPESLIVAGTNSWFYTYSRL